MTTGLRAVPKHLSRSSADQENRSLLGPGLRFRQNLLLGLTLGLRFLHRFLARLSALRLAALRLQFFNCRQAVVDLLLNGPNVTGT